MLTASRIDRRTTWIAGATFAGSLSMQLAIIATAALRSGSSSYDGTPSVLLDRHAHLGDVAAVAGMNCAWLAAIAMLAWPIARLWSWSIHDTWDRPGVNVAARFLYPLVAVVLLVTLWLGLLRAGAGAGHAARVALGASGHALAWHLEFAALLLPLVAAASCIFAPAEKPGRLLLRALAIALPLLVLAAIVEVYVTPQLLIPLQS